MFLGCHALRRGYQATSDGFTTHLRRQLSARRYLGIELEINQASIAMPGLVRALCQRLKESVAAVS